jgi:hypothetical protein
VSEPWREFEKLVARIEGLLCPAGAVVKCPDRLRKIKGRGTRQVDASIRYVLGSTKVLVTVECRKRYKGQDVTWIEQLATKRRNIGAHHTLAVSTTEFSEEALEIAQREVIGTRVISEVTDDDIRALVDEQLVVKEHGVTLTLGRAALSYHGTPETADLDEKTVQLVREMGWDAPVFVEQASGSEHSLTHLVAKANASLPAEGEGSPLGHGAKVVVPPKVEAAIFSNEPLSRLARTLTPGVMKVIQIDLDEDEYLVSTTAGRLRLKSVAFEVTATGESERRVPIDRIVRYKGADHGEGVYAERKLAWGDDEIILTTHTPTPTSKTKVTLARETVRRHRGSPAPPRAVRRRR